MDDEDSAAIQVYTDGSGKDGKIGAAAVLYKNGRKKSDLRFLLGSDTEHTVPEAEGVGLVLGMELIRREYSAGRASIAADNVGSITRSMSIQVAPSQHIWEMMLKRWGMTKRKHTGLRLTIRWIPGHEGVVGNEEADRLVNMAVKKGSSRRNELPAPLRKGIPRSKAAAWRVNKAKLAQRATKAWTESPRYAKLRYVVGRMPSKHFLGLTAELPRKKASLLFQLWSGHIPLRAHLHRITQADSPNCGQCNGSRETVHHFLMMCPKYAEARRTMAAEGGRSVLQMSKLLNSAKLLPHLFKFVAHTGRFTETLGDIDTIK
jgi:ribonuclease HI